MGARLYNLCVPDPSGGVDDHAEHDPLRTGGALAAVEGAPSLPEDIAELARAEALVPSSRAPTLATPAKPRER